MNTFELICLLSLVVDILLLFAFYYLYRKINVISPQKIDLLIKTIQETKILTDELQKILDKKLQLSKEIKQYLSPKQQNNNSIIDNKTKVIQLYKKGLDIQDISRHTNLTQGEVELILSIATQFKN